MADSPGFLLTILAFAAVLGPLVFVHEMGHYLVGRIFGVHAEAFSIGFGPEITAWQDRRGTRWRIAALPLGGYVKFAGDMNAASMADPAWLELSPEERNRTFPAKPLWQRALIVAAGPAVNFLFAILILAGFALVDGQNVTPAIVNDVQPGTVAAAAGIKPGDRIVAVDATPISHFDDLSRAVVDRPGEKITLTLMRAKQRLSVPLTIGLRIERDRFGHEYRLGMLGVISKSSAIEPVSPLMAPVVAARQTGQFVVMMVDGLGQIITGRRSVGELGGPLMIAQISGERAARGPSDFIFFIAFISINLGFINLLPIPVLDGGHLLFYAIEALQRRPVGGQTLEWAYRSGLALLLAVMMFVTLNDLSTMGLWKQLSRLIG